MFCMTSRVCQTLDRVCNTAWWAGIAPGHPRSSGRQADNDISAINPSHHPPWWLADHICYGHLAMSHSQRSRKHFLQTDRISHTHFTNEKTVKLPVLSEGSPSLSTPPREQERVGERNPCADLFWTTLLPRPHLLLHIREVGDLNQTFPDNQGPDASLYKSVTLLLSSETYSPYYSEVSCKLI